jgi:hypothetical protein
MVNYYFKNDLFIIEDYDKAKPFASFLPSIAGLYGIPAWVYYVNRGQSIAGFGVENKDNPIMDFVPANSAYRRTELVGFRTFAKVDGEVYEFFSSLVSSKNVTRKMSIGRNIVKVSEKNTDLGLEIFVEYVNVTNQSYPGLVRHVIIKNLTSKPRHIELLDGLANIWPYGTNDFVTKNMTNLGVAWFDVLSSKDGIPYYKNRSTTSDSSAVGSIENGHFYASYLKGNKEPLKVIYDFEQVFDQNTALTIAEGFKNKSISEMLNSQYYVNKFSCAFSTFDGELVDELELGSIIGRMSSIELLDKAAVNFNLDYVKDQIKQALELGESVTNDCVSSTSSSMFDAYVKQCFLDNLLRGGYPLVFKGKDQPIIYHVYSRVHGDMEREYNYFFVEPSYFSQGNGNFRDVNQNRRNDVYFVKEAGLFNLKQFMELIQVDGNNPLGIQGSKLILASESLDMVLSHFGSHQEMIKKILSSKFTPGQLLTTISDYEVKVDIGMPELVELVMANSTQEIQSNYGHGYWSDHWTYNMDLIENYLNIYPDKISELLFDLKFRYFVSPSTVLPRIDKYVLNKDGNVRQYDAVINEDKEKIVKCQLEKNGTNWQKTVDGKLLTSSLYVKLLSLAVNKFADLDQYGIGVMMNGDKPGWNDAMNGLPGLFGSGMSETVELNRLVKFLISNSEDHEIDIYEELVTLMDQIKETLIAYNYKQLTEIEYWEKIQDYKEAYLANTRFGVTGKCVTTNVTDLEQLLSLMASKISIGIEKGIAMSKEGIIPTYLVYEAKEYEVIPDKYHPINKLPNVKVTKWQGRILPLFLEAPARYFKQLTNLEKAKHMYKEIKSSAMFDRKINMYITSQSLEKETLEIGRTRAFTAGWLERESCFMHMEYKYLLGLLKTGLYDEFFSDMKTCLLPFTDPKVYGRSTLENSSFIASSVNPNPNNHGRGFVARLTGTTSEMLSMWIIMMMGKHVFSYKNNQLIFKLEPIIVKDLFKEDNTVEFKFLGHTIICYHNDKKKNTYGEDGVKPVSYTLVYSDKSVKTINSSYIEGSDALDIRDGKVDRIDVILS